MKKEEVIFFDMDTIEKKLIRKNKVSLIGVPLDVYRGHQILFNGIIHEIQRSGGHKKVQKKLCLVLLDIES